MSFSTFKKAAITVGAAALALILWHWVLPVALPFALGALVALAAEPLVRLLCRRLKLNRTAAAGISVTAALLAVLSLAVLVTALLLRQLTGLSHTLPTLIDTARNSLSSLELLLSDLSDRAPQDLRPLLHRTVDNVFHDGGNLLDTLVQRIPAAASALLGYVTDSFLAVGTGCLAAYMLSTRLPKLKQWAQNAPEDSLYAKALPRLRRIRSALWGWLKAQFRLSAMCFVILLVGFLLLKLPYAPLWAVLIALVDAVPLLGTGTVLIPWALVCFLQKNTARAIGLLGIYTVAALSRSAMEPRLVGKQLGLDPLVTLISLYAGYLFWGFGGMLLSPILCVIVKEAATAPE